MTIKDLISLPDGIVFNGKTGKEYSKMARKTIDAIYEKHSPESSYNADDSDGFGSSEYWEKLDAYEKERDAFLSKPASVLTSRD